PQKFIVFRCLPLTLTSNPLSKARGRPDRHLSRYPTMRVTLFVKKCGATSTPRVGQSRLRSNTGSEAGDDNRYGRHPNNSRMSALGRSRHWQKLTCAAHKLMSALGQKRTLARYSINSSARSSNDRGKVIPIALAVLRLMTSSILVGNSTGRSPGLVPFKILST